MNGRSQLVLGYPILDREAVVHHPPPPDRIALGSGIYEMGCYARLLIQQILDEADSYSRWMARYSNPARAVDAFAGGPS